MERFLNEKGIENTFFALKYVTLSSNYQTHKKQIFLCFLEHMVMCDVFH